MKPGESYAAPLYARFFLRFALLLLVFIPALILSAILYHNTQNAAQEQALNANAQLASQVETNVNNQLDSIESIYQKLSAESILNVYLNKPYIPAVSFSELNTSVMAYVKGIMGDGYRSSLQIYMANDTLPEGYGVFYKLSRIREHAVIEEFLQAEERNAFLTPDDFTGIDSCFSVNSDSVIYLGKLYDSGEVSAIVKVLLPESAFWLDSDSDPFQFYSQGDIRYLNYSSQQVDYAAFSDGGHGIQDGLCYDTLRFDGLPFQVVLITDAAASPVPITSIWIAILFAALAGTFVMTFRFTRNVYRCLDQMQLSIGSGFSIRLPVSGRDEISVISRSINLLLDRIQHLMRRAVEQEALTKQTQLYALQNQINPHFIYNTLEIFSSKFELYGAFEESEAISDFSRMLRYNLNNPSPFATLGEEIQQLNRYLHIQRIRYPSIACTLAVPEEFYSCRVLRFLLQPFVENSIKHGLDQAKETFKIYISASKVGGGQLLFHIYDNGRGIGKERLAGLQKELENPPSGDAPSTSSIGLGNINRRLNLFFGKKYRIEVFSQEGEWTLVSFVVPFSPEADAASIGEPAPDTAEQEEEARLTPR